MNESMVREDLLFYEKWLQQSKPHEFSNIILNIILIIEKL